MSDKIKTDLAWWKETAGELMEACKSALWENDGHLERGTSRPIISVALSRFAAGPEGEEE